MQFCVLKDTLGHVLKTWSLFLIMPTNRPSTYLLIYSIRFSSVVCDYNNAAFSVSKNDIGDGSLCRCKPHLISHLSVTASPRGEACESLHQRTASVPLPLGKGGWFSLKFVQTKLTYCRGWRPRHPVKLDTSSVTFGDSFPSRGSLHKPKVLTEGFLYTNTAKAHVLKECALSGFLRDF